jgi:xanthine dehydrogenase YagS FAD-binding subunit
MKNFTYYRPITLDQAVGLLGSEWGKTELLAGGTDLHDLQKEYIAQPEKVVSLGAIKAVDSILAFDGIVPIRDGSFDIGAGVKLADLAAHPQLRERAPALTTAAGDVGGPQIRNMGTLGGNLCQRNRCWYFRDEHTNCLLKGGERCFALDGENRYHAIFTQGHKCVIVNPSTLAPPLIALGASVEVQGAKGKRTVEVAELFQAPTKPSQREHVLAPDEMIVKVQIPTRLVQPLKNASYEVRHKLSYDWPLVQAAVAFKFDGDKASDVRIVLGHVAPTPHLAKAAAQALEGKDVSDESAAAAGKAAAEGAKPLSQNEYKIKLVEVAVKRAVLTAAGHKKYWEV